MAEFKMTAIIKLSQNESVKFFCANVWEPNLGKCEWIRQGQTKMDEIKMAKFKMAEFKMTAIIS